MPPNLTLMALGVTYAQHNAKEYTYMRTFQGLPVRGLPFEATFHHEPDDTAWVLQDRSQPENIAKGWRPYKLSASPSAPNKANYWFSVSTTGARFARSKDLALMLQHRPALYDALVTHFNMPKRKATDAPAPEPEPEAPSTHLGTVRGLWDVSVIRDDLGWDLVTVSADDGREWTFLWNGTEFKQTEAWIEWSGRYIRSVPDLESLLRD